MLYIWIRKKLRTFAKPLIGLESLIIHRESSILSYFLVFSTSWGNEFHNLPILRWWWWWDFYGGDSFQCIFLTTYDCICFVYNQSLLFLDSLLWPQLSFAIALLEKQGTNSLWVLKSWHTRAISTMHFLAFVPSKKTCIWIFGWCCRELLARPSPRLWNLGSVLKSDHNYWAQLFLTSCITCR